MRLRSGHTALCAVALACVASGAAAARPAQPRFGMDTDTLLQIELERRMFSMNMIDGAWGDKSNAALAAWLEATGKTAPATREEALKMLRGATNGEAPPPPYRLRRVTRGDVASLAKIPATPAEKSRMAHMGHETLLEKFAELGHTSETAMRRLNPGAAWPNPPVGTAIRIPNVTVTNKPPKAALVKVNLAKCQITAFDSAGKMLAFFPCSIAADKSKRPKAGEIHVQGIAPAPNYTYTSEKPDGSGRRRKYIYPAGPNNPVGTAWIGLSIPSYGIHGTPNPETIGRAESHGCFRLSNWNAIRLRDMVDEGCKVVIE